MWIASQASNLVIPLIMHNPFYMPGIYLDNKIIKSYVPIITVVQCSHVHRCSSQVFYITYTSHAYYVDRRLFPTGRNLVISVEVYKHWEHRIQSSLNSFQPAVVSKLNSPLLPRGTMCILIGLDTSYTFTTSTKLTFCTVGL